MRILHTSDWHLGKCLEQISRIEEQKEFIDSLVTIADEESIDLVLIAGDVFDTYNPSAAAEELFYDALERLNNKGRRAVVVIAGNHDNPDRLCAASPLAYKNGIIMLGYPKSDPGEYKIENENIKIVDSGPGWLELSLIQAKQNAVILLLPYPSESRLNEIISARFDEESLQKAYSEKIESLLSELSDKYKDDTVNLAVAHFFLQGGKESESERTLQVGGAMTVRPSALPPKAQYVALGHLHRPQKVKNAPCPAYYSGSPLAYSFSEAGQAKAVYIIDASPGKEAVISERLLNCGKPLVKWAATKGVEQAIRWCEEGRDKDAWIDLEILTDRVITMEEQKRLRQYNPGIINIRPIFKSETAVDLVIENRENKKIEELFKDYYKYSQGIEIPDDLFEVFLEITYGEEEQEKAMKETAAGGEE